VRKQKCAEKRKGIRL